MGYQPQDDDEQALRRAERIADADLFEVDPDFARSIGVDLTPLAVACWGRGHPVPPGGMVSPLDAPPAPYGTILA